MGETTNIYFAKEGDLSVETLKSIRDFVNEAYERGEEGMWKAGTSRTSVGELKAKIESSQLVVAEQNKEILGVILVHKTASIQTAEFGMLAVKASCTKQGVGGQLINYAEQWALSEGMTMMRLELLTPTDWKQSTKEFLKNWYRRLGYLPKRNTSFEKDFPHLAPSLKTACVFTEWTKKLL